MKGGDSYLDHSLRVAPSSAQALGGGLQLQRANRPQEIPAPLASVFVHRVHSVRSRHPPWNPRGRPKARKRFGVVFYLTGASEARRCFTKASR